MRTAQPILRWFVTALSAFAQAAALVFWSVWAITHHLPRRHGIVWIALVAVASIVATVIHECGHAVIAWCFEMKLHSFKAGPFQWSSREGNWAFRFNAAGLFTPGGSISASPTRPEQPAWEYLMMIVAGPGANMLLGAAATWAVLHDRWSSYQQSWEFVAYAGAFCLIGAVLNLIPFRTEEGSYSDGARILQIATGNPLFEVPAAPAVAAAADIPEAAPTRLVITPPLVAAPMTVPDAAPQVVKEIADSIPVAAAPARPTLKSAPAPAGVAVSKPAPSVVVASPQSVAETPPTVVDAATPKVDAISTENIVPIPPSAALAKPTVAAGSIRPADPIVAIAAKKEVAPAIEPPILAAIPATVTAAKKLGPPPPADDDLLAARLQSFLARPATRPAAKAVEAAAPAQTPAAPTSPAPPTVAETARQEPIPTPVPRVAAQVEKKLADPFTRIAAVAPAPSAPAADPVAAGPAKAVAAAVNQELNAQAAPPIKAAAEGKLSEPFAAPGPSVDSLPIPNAAPEERAAVQGSDVLLKSAETQSSFAAPEPIAGGVIASVTRIPSSALTPAASKPPAIRLASAAAAPAAPTAAGAKAVSVPSAFARRPRPAPLSGLPGIEEILAAAAVPVDDGLPTESIAIEEPAPVAPAASENLHPVASVLSSTPAGLTSALGTPVSDAEPVGLTFSEQWPPRPTTPAPPRRSESIEAAPSVSADAPAAGLRVVPSETAVAETAMPSPPPETRRSDPFDFFRAAAIESLNANAG